MLKERLNFLIDNQDKVLKDDYGRVWFYEKYSFFFKDIGSFDVFKEELSCLHLLASETYIIREDDKKNFIHIKKA